MNAAHAATPAVMIDVSLKPRPVLLQSLGDGGVGVFDEQRKYTSLPLDQILQIRVLNRRPAGVAEANPSAVIEITDGQRLPGKWAGASDDGQSLIWESPRRGKLPLSLDRVKSITWKAEAESEKWPEGAGDRLLLANGDTVEGFVTAIYGDAVEIKPAGQSAAIKLPLDRLRAAHFANPPVQPKGQSLLYFADGSRLRVTKLAIADDRIKADFVLHAADEKSPVPVIALADVARIDLATGAGTLVELAALTPEIVSGGEVFGLSMPPHGEGSDVVMHAPVVVKYALPKGARRFAAEARCEAGAADAASWVDFDVVAKVDGKPVGEWRFDAAHPTHALNFALDGAALSFELRAGANGPVLDRLRLADAVLLVKGQ